MKEESQVEYASYPSLRGRVVLVTGGATLSLGNNPFPNLGQSQNTLTLSPNAAVISVSGAAQVKQGP